MNASLRLRLALLVVCSVALTVALVLYLTWQRVGETMIGMEEKNKVSHRAKATENLLEKFDEWWNE